MAKEVINNTERFILIQIDEEGTEHVVYQDSTGSFTTSEVVNHAQDFESEKNAKETMEALNLLCQLTNKKQHVKVVKEVVDRTDLLSDKTIDSETM